MFAKWLGRIFVAAAVGFVGGIPLVDASGIEGDRDAAEPIAGIMVGCLTLTALVFGEMQLRNLFAVLARTKQRPGTALVVLLICGGVALFILAVLLQLLGGPGASVSAEPGAVSAKLNVRPSIMVPITTLALLVVGAMLIGLGIWGGIPPASQDPVAKKPPPIGPDIPE